VTPLSPASFASGDWSLIGGVGAVEGVALGVGVGLGLMLGDGVV
jgi:hypothetical protein